MLIIPGLLIAVLTFPGVFLHEYAHKLACELAGVKVNKVCYFRFSNPAGYVIHEQPKNLWQSLLISFSPLLVGYGLTVILAAFIPSFNKWVLWLGLWLSFSFAIHAIPSDDDVNTLWISIRQNPSILCFVIYPLGFIMKILNFLKHLWIDVVIAYFLIASVNPSF